jgi:hypothetical protein
MLDQIRGDLRIQPRVSVVIAVTAIALTSLMFFEPKLTSVYGVNNNDGVSFWTRTSVPFIHGYDTSAITGFALLGINIFLFYLLGTFIEKILGGLRFLILCSVTFLVYILLHRAMLMIGHGLTPLIMAFSSFSLILLLECRFVKTSSSYDDYFKTMWIVNIFVWLATPVLMSIIPIYFDSHTTGINAVITGNILIVAGWITGLIMGFIFRGHLRKNLVHYARKKYIKHSKIDNSAWIVALLIPIYLLLLFFI